MPPNHLNLYHPLLLLPSILPSIRVFSKESVLPIRWPKYWNFSFNINPSKEFSSMQSLSHVRLFAHQASLSITISQSSPRPTSTESVMPSSHLILGQPLLLLPPIRVFSNESTLLMRWQKYWSFSLRIIPSKEIPGLISFRMDWLDLLAVQGTLKSLLQGINPKRRYNSC